MYDQSLILDELQNIENLLQTILEWTKHIQSENDFLTSTEGVILLDAVCMKLLAVGETVKALDKRTNKQLLPQYPSIPWRNIMGMRDFIAHHYFEVDAAQIFGVLSESIPPLLAVIREIKQDITAI
jgi:uncharacterized protein with HEPN domain